MSVPSLGFIGGGRVARIMVGGWARAGVLPPDVRVLDPDATSLAQLSAAEPSVRAADLADVAAADVVFVAVPPPAAAAALDALRGLLAPGTVVVSLVPTVRLERVAEVLGADRQLARVVPNAPSIVGAGFNPVAFGPTTTVATRALLLELLAPLGRAPEVPDSDLESYAILTAMGPTYLWSQLYALVGVAEGTGLEPAAAMDALRAMVDGALATMADGGLTPEQTQDLIPSRPLAEPVAAMTAAYGAVLPGLHARLTGQPQ